jgi:hypothetical protein
MGARAGDVVKVLDLFAGLGGWSQAFVERGHEVVTLDLDPRFGCDITGDILDSQTMYNIVTMGPYDVVLASPPCEGFSVMNIGKNWTPPPDHQPRTDTARLAVRIVERTRFIIDRLEPAAFIIENPRAKLRKLPVMDGLERRTTMKPTDLWGGFPPTLHLAPPCRNGDPCHESAPRGSSRGVQGIKDSAERAKVPYLLSLTVCKAMEEWLENGTQKDTYQPDEGQMVLL